MEAEDCSLFTGSINVDGRIYQANLKTLRLTGIQVTDHGLQFFELIKTIKFTTLTIDRLKPIESSSQQLGAIDGIEQYAYSVASFLESLSLSELP